jgi:hypothetical protein
MREERASVDADLRCDITPRIKEQVTLKIMVKKAGLVASWAIRMFFLRGKAFHGSASRTNTTIYFGDSRTTVMGRLVLL